jgi:hypothetical protein
MTVQIHSQVFIPVATYTLPASRGFLPYSPRKSATIYTCILKPQAVEVKLFQALMLRAVILKLG